MAVAKYTIAISSKGVSRKICKVWFGSDGSYYITVPYHSAHKALLFKMTVNYTNTIPKSVDDHCWTPLSEAIDVGSSDDARIKLSHHPSGFTQFSGHGLVSGKNPDGTCKGIGIDSWPLANGCRGPAFCVSISGIEEFEEETHRSSDVCVFNLDKLTIIPGFTSLILEGHYFPSLWRRFIRTRVDGTRIIPIVHPEGVILELLVILPNDDCPIGGFIGFDFFGGRSRRSAEKSGYCLSSSTGNCRKNDKGELLGDGLYCFYPRPEESPTCRSLDYQLPQGPEM